MANSAAPSAGRIFISYRREETAWQAGWLFNNLADRFGRGQIFKDIDSVEPGANWPEAITSAVASCDVLLALIGEQWLTITDEHGRPRLDNPKDFVRLEIEAALTRNVRVIPILIAGTRMPAEDQLPPSLAKLAHRQALELTPSHFEFDTSRLHKVLERSLADSQQLHLADAYQRALNAEAASEWTHAANAYAEILDVDATYRDAAARRDACRARQQVIDLHDKLRRHAAAGQWLAVLDISAELGRLDPGAADPDGLATQARHAVDDERAAAGPRPPQHPATPPVSEPPHRSRRPVLTSGPPTSPTITVTAPEPPSRPHRARWIAIVLATVLLIGGGIAWSVIASGKPAANGSTAGGSKTPSSPASSSRTAASTSTSRAASPSYPLIGDAPAYTGPSVDAYGPGHVVPRSTRVNVVCDLYGELVNTGLWHYTDHGWLNDHYVRTGKSDPVRNACTGNVNKPTEGSQPPSPLVGPFGAVGPQTIPVRNAAGSGAAQVDTVEPDQLITLVCHVQADFVDAPAGGSSSADWDQVGPGRWIPDADLLTGHSGSPAPACAPSSPFGGGANPNPPPNPTPTTPTTPTTPIPTTPTTPTPTPTPTPSKSLGGG
jgi:hypothetical protein